jgi:hypothetical protein
MTVAFDIKDYIKWRQVLADLDEQVAKFKSNLAYLKETRFKIPSLESQRKELLGKGISLSNRVAQLERGLSTMRDFMAGFRQEDNTQLAGLPLLPVFAAISLGGVIILVGQLTSFNQAIQDVRLAEIQYVEGGGNIEDIRPANKTKDNIQSLALLAGIVLGGFFLIRRFS